MRTSRVVCAVHLLANVVYVRWFVDRADAHLIKSDMLGVWLWTGEGRVCCVCTSCLAFGSITDTTSLWRLRESCQCGPLPVADA
jgi:hypothetical protein